MYIVLGLLGCGFKCLKFIEYNIYVYFYIVKEILHNNAKSVTTRQRSTKEEAEVRMDERAYFCHPKAKEIIDGGTCITEGRLFKRQAHFRECEY